MFDRARLTRWHYQWAVIHDFLPRFVGDELVGTSGTVYKEVAGKSPVINLSYYKPTNKGPAVHAGRVRRVAAYRFGHSLIRPFYVINDSGVVDVFGSEGAVTSTAAGPYRSTWSIDWKNILPDLGNPDARKPRKIDTKLSIPLSNLPGSAVPLPDPTINLAVRNTAGARKSACHRGSRSRRRCGSPSVQQRAGHRFGMGRRGAAVVLHSEGGRAAVQR